MEIVHHNMGTVAMLTPYGKQVRKYRIDAEMTLREMAKALGKSSAFVSGMETGRKRVGEETVNKVAGILELDLEERESLLRAAEESRNEHRVVLGQGATADEREVAAMFARQFGELTSEQRNGIKRILAGRKSS